MALNPYVLFTDVERQAWQDHKHKHQEVEQLGHLVSIALPTSSSANKLYTIMKPPAATLDKEFVAPYVTMTHFYL